MKKKIFTFLLAICLVLPCMLILTACGGDKDSVTITFESNSYNDAGVNSIRIEDYNEFSSTGGLSYANWFASGENNHALESNLKKDKEFLMLIILNEGFDLGTLQYTIDGEAFTPEPIKTVLTRENHYDAAADYPSNMYAAKWDGLDKSFTLGLTGNTTVAKYHLATTYTTYFTDDDFFNALNFSISIDGVLYENADHETVLNGQEFVDAVEDLYSSQAIYAHGTNLTFGVWFADGVRVFNITDFVKAKVIGSLDDFSDVNGYYDKQTKTTYFTVDINSDMALKFDFARLIEDYLSEVDCAYLSLYVGGNCFNAEEVLTCADIFDVSKGAVYTVSVGMVDYALLMKDYCTVKINDTKITNSEKEQMFSYEPSTGYLTIDIGNVHPYELNDENFLTGKGTFIYGEDYRVEISVDDKLSLLLADSDFVVNRVKTTFEGEEFFSQHLEENICLAGYITWATNYSSAIRVDEVEYLVCLADSEQMELQFSVHYSVYSGNNEYEADNTRINFNLDLGGITIDFVWDTTTGWTTTYENADFVIDAGGEQVNLVVTGDSLELITKIDINITRVPEAE